MSERTPERKRDTTDVALETMLHSAGWELAERALRERLDFLMTALANGTSYNLEQVRDLQGQIKILRFLIESPEDFLRPDEAERRGE